MTIVPAAALQVLPSQHLCHLACHKTYPSLLIRPNTEWDWSEWQSMVSPAAKTAQASSRVIELAETKKDHLLYKPCKLVFSH